MRATLVAALVAALLLPGLVEAQSTQRSKKRKGKKGEAAGAAAWMLPDASAAPSAKELAQLFPGASAVIALDGVQHQWSTDKQVTTVQRRVRLIDGRGLEMELFVPEGSGHWSVKEGSAKVAAISKKDSNAGTEAKESDQPSSAWYVASSDPITYFPVGLPAWTQPL